MFVIALLPALDRDLRPLLANAADHPDWSARQLADHRLGKAPPPGPLPTSVPPPVEAAPDAPDRLAAARATMRTFKDQR